jgi:hypothetical protein
MKAAAKELKELWSAVTCHRFTRFAGLTAKQSRVQRLAVLPARAPAFGGDKSPAESAAKSAHSKAAAASPRCVLCGCVVDRIASTMNQHSQLYLSSKGGGTCRAATSSAASSGATNPAAASTYPTSALPPAERGRGRRSATTATSRRTANGRQ